MTESKHNAFPDFGLTPAQQVAAVREHRYEYQGMDGHRGEIWCYTDRYSYQPGSLVTLYVSSTSPTYELNIVRDGAVETNVLRETELKANWQPVSEQCSVLGCGWSESFQFAIPSSWSSGGYRITLKADGLDGGLIECHHFFIVRPPLGKRSGRYLQVAATGTWTAYNTWGGSNHYEGFTGPDKNLYATAVSTQRPWGRGFISLPPDAPRVPLKFATPLGTRPRYPHMEWAYAHGYSKKYASAGWATYDSHFFRWAERHGFGVDLVSQHDLHFEPEILDGYDCVAFVGHDEYWTWEMRDAVDSYVERGGKVARFAGNFMWQARLEDEGRRHVCFKYRARDEDPIYRSDVKHRTTTAWEAPEIQRPGALTFGLNATNGIYAGWGGCAARGVRGFPVYRPEHWAFKGTGLYYGDLLGADAQVYGYEVDGLDYVIRGGLPYPSSRSGAPGGLVILALGVASLIEESADLVMESSFLADDDARFVAETTLGGTTRGNLDRVKRGSGMIVNFSRGKGEVFHAGSCEWVAGLKSEDPMVTRVTANVLEKYLASD